MSTLTKAEFKRWQVLPVLSQPLDEDAGAVDFQEGRASESAGPLLARRGLGGCRSRQSDAATHPLPQLPDLSANRRSQRS